jgi:hypothetical protein
MIEIELRQLIAHMAHWGFDLLDPPHSGSPGGRMLLVAMRRRPTTAHYDPENLALLLADERGALGTTTLQGGARFARPARVCPGHITITDRVHKRVDFYSFGGTLNVLRVPESPPYTLFILQSPAPILALNSLLGHQVEDQLVNSTEALYARLRARYAVQHLDLPPLLVKIPPLSLYAACIESLWRMYHRSPTLPTVFGDFYRLLATERQWLVGLDGAGPPLVSVESLVADRIAKAVPV